MLIVFILITNKVLIFDICIIFLGLHVKELIIQIISQVNLC